MHKPSSLAHCITDTSHWPARLQTKVTKCLNLDDSLSLGLNTGGADPGPGEPQARGPGRPGLWPLVPLSLLECLLRWLGPGAASPDSGLLPEVQGEDM